MDSFHFEWDQNKNQSNDDKHGVLFEEAQTVFYDDNHSLEEERFIMLGMSYQFRLLVVCYCVINHNFLRIISARKATKKEAKSYERGI